MFFHGCFFPLSCFFWPWHLLGPTYAICCSKRPGALSGWPPPRAFCPSAILAHWPGKVSKKKVRWSFIYFTRSVLACAFTSEPWSLFTSACAPSSEAWSLATSRSRLSIFFCCSCEGQWDSLQNDDVSNPCILNFQIARSFVCPNVVMKSQSSDLMDYIVSAGSPCLFETASPFCRLSELVALDNDWR